jgi:phage baseplate assembly protein W
MYTERTDIAFPFRIGRRGRTAVAGHDDHVRDLIEQLLFTSPGERVMRPDFGCGLADLTFTPNSPELAAALELSVHAALQRRLGDLIALEALDVDGDDATVHVRVRYVVRRTGTRREEILSRTREGGAT